jgi:hypothetical protein
VPDKEGEEDQQRAQHQGQGERVVQAQHEGVALEARGASGGMGVYG